MMRTGWIATAIVTTLALGTVAAITRNQVASGQGTRDQALGPNPVIVELFTSQG